MIKDALAIFSSLDEMQESENWLRYQFFIPFDKPDTVRDAILYSIPERVRDDGEIQNFIEQSFSRDKLNSEKGKSSDEEINSMLGEMSHLKLLDIYSRKHQPENASLKHLAGFPINYVINKIKELPDIFSFKLPYNLFGCGNLEKRLGIFYSDGQTQSDILYDHCAISSLHTVKYLIYALKQRESKSKQDKPTSKQDSPTLKPTSAYKYINRASREYGTPGYFTLNAINYDMSKLNPFYFEENQQTQYESTVSNFLKKKGITPFTLNLLGKREIQKKNKLDIPQYNIDFHDHILRCNQFLSSVEMKGFKKRTLALERFETFMQYYQEIAFAKPFRTDGQNSDIDNAIKIDYLLLQYQLERFFNASLFEELLEQSRKLEAPNMNLLLKFSLLPNVFHRKRYVQCAFNMLGDEGIFNNYNSNPEELSSLTQLVSLTTFDTARIHKTPISLEAEWTKNTEFAIDFLSKIHFPFYEKCFFIYLYRLCEKEGDCPINILKKMEESLYWYCLNIYDTLEIPKTSNIVGTKENYAFYLDILNRLMQEEDLYARYKKTYSMEYFTAYATKHGYKATPQYSHANRIKYLRTLSMMEALNAKGNPEQP